jgi:hypothetical protein
MTSSGIEPAFFRLVAYWYATICFWLIIFKLANTFCIHGSFFYDDSFGSNKGGEGGRGRRELICRYCKVRFCNCEYKNMVIMGWPKPELSEYRRHRWLASCLSLEQQMQRRLTHTYCVNIHTFSTNDVRAGIAQSI